MPDHSPSTDERASLAQPSQSSSPLECTSHRGFSLVPKSLSPHQAPKPLRLLLVRRPRRFRLAQRPHQLLQSNPAKLKPPFEPLKGRGNTEGKSQPVATVLAATASATG